MNKENNILIIGGNGFVGSHLIELFLKMGMHVRVLDRYHERHRAPLPGVEYFIGDYSDSEILSQALESRYLVVHLACTSTPTTSAVNCRTDIQENLLPVIHLLEKMVEKNCKKILFFSSGGTVYGNASVFPVSENAPLQPISSYGIIKAGTELYINMYSLLFGIKALIVRPSNLYGPRQNNIGINGFINTLLYNIAGRREMKIWGDGTAVRDFIHISDLISFLEKAIAIDAQGVFNVGSGKHYIINDIIHEAAEITSVVPLVKYEESRLFDVKKVILDIRKSKVEIGWEPEISLRKGMELMWNDMLKQYDR